MSPSTALDNSTCPLLTHLTRIATLQIDLRLNRAEHWQVVRTAFPFHWSSLAYSLGETFVLHPCLWVPCNWSCGTCMSFFFAVHSTVFFPILSSSTTLFGYIWSYSSLLRMGFYGFVFCFIFFSFSFFFVCVHIWVHGPVHMCGNSNSLLSVILCYSLPFLKQQGLTVSYFLIIII